MTTPYSIRIFLPGGDPDGLRTIEKSNWSGAGIVLPRLLTGEANLSEHLELFGPPLIEANARESNRRSYSELSLAVL
jgi:hypothetical protein